MSEMKYKNATVADVLHHYGKDVSYYRGGFFRSPFRDEASPSFHVSSNGRAWTDFGSAESGEPRSGGVFDLIMALEPTSDREVARRICTAIERGENRIDLTEISMKLKRESAEGFIIRSENPIVPARRYLVEYASGRGIPESVLCRYCREVVVSPANYPDMRNTYIGFRNSKGSWTLRNGNAKYGKRSTGSAPTYISADGRMSDVPSSENVVVFEGFFDFLSYMAMGLKEGTVVSPDLSPGTDVCVLNSIVNADEAMSYITGHNIITLFLDNDGGGRKTTELIRDRSLLCGHTPLVEDCSPYFAECNDLNEYLCKYGSAPP